MKKRLFLFSFAIIVLAFILVTPGIAAIDNNQGIDQEVIGKTLPSQETNVIQIVKAIDQEVTDEAALLSHATTQIIEASKLQIRETALSCNRIDPATLKKRNSVPNGGGGDSNFY
jgi:hypothetical protein